MDNLGKACGQFPTVSTPLRTCKSAADSPDFSIYLREKKVLFFARNGAVIRCGLLHK